MTKRTILLLAAACLGMAACIPTWPYNTMASHTLRAGPDQDLDVVWVQHSDGKLYRCAQTPNGPTCVAVKKD